MYVLQHCCSVLQCIAVIDHTISLSVLCDTANPCVQCVAVYVTMRGSVCCTLQHVQHIPTPCNIHCNAFVRRIADVSAIRCSVCYKVLQCMLYTATCATCIDTLIYFLKKKPSQSCPRRPPDCETALFFFKHLLRCVAVTYSMSSLAL